jgi:hypothetical protein
MTDWPTLTIRFGPLSDYGELNLILILSGGKLKKDESWVTCSLRLPFRPAQIPLILRALNARQYPDYPHRERLIRPNEDRTNIISELQALDLWSNTADAVALDVHVQVGRLLGAALLSEPKVKYVFDRLYDETMRARGGEIVLRFDVEAMVLAALPWELIHDGQQPMLLTKDVVLNCIRVINSMELPLLPPRVISKRLRVLTISPTVLMNDVENAFEQVARYRMRDALYNLPVDFEFLTPASMEALHKRLDQGPAVDILDYYGHRVSTDKGGALLLETSQGRFDTVISSRLAAMPNLPPLIVLQLLPSTSLYLDELHTEIAASLITAGVGAVIAMQLTTRMTDVTNVITPTLYQELAEGKSIQQAIATIRQKLYLADPDEASWYLPKLYLNRPDNKPFMLEVSSPVSTVTQQRDQAVKDTTVEQQQEIEKGTTLIYGPVQGFVQGEHNTVTLIFQGNKERSIPFLAPPQLSYNLVGRDDLIRELKEQLFHAGNLALSALNGLPGVGKTALALALTHDHEVLGHFCDGVLWAGLGREPDVFSTLSTWAAAIGISQSEMKELTDLTTLTQAIHRAIAMHKMLLVIDDAWTAEAALTFKVGGPNCAHLLTTRIPEVAEVFTSGRIIVVHELNDKDGTRLLRQFAPEVVERAPDEVRELVRVVGGLPLPLTVMGNYLRLQMRTEQPRRLRSALDRFREVKERLELGQPQVGLERHPSLPEGVQLSLLTVIKISDEALDEESRQTLRALGVFPSKPNTFSEEAALAVASTSIRVIDTLIDFGLLESGGPGRYTLHQTISDYAKSQLMDMVVYERVIEFFIKYVEDHKTESSLLEREASNILAAMEVMFERDMHPTGVSAFAHFIPIMRRTRTI